MFGELFKGSDLVSWPLVALFFFIAVFVGVLVYVARRRPEHDHIARLPLAEEENHD
jgi:cbb3-type cytochrome oxidase subunit 3